MRFQRAALIFLVGAAAGWLFAAVTRPTTGELRDSGPDASAMGVRYEYGDEARRESAVAGIQIPEGATDIFYGIGGLKPVNEFVAFTVPSQDAWKVVESLSGKKKSEAHANPAFDKPNYFEGKYRTVLFNVDDLKSKTGVEWTLRGGHLQAACLVDEAIGRIFIVIRDFD